MNYIAVDFEWNQAQSSKQTKILEDGKRFSGEIIQIGAVKLTEKIDLVINMEQWDTNKNYDRMGLETQKTEILGLQIPSLTIPVKPGRNLAVIIEVAAMNSRQKKLGYNAAEDLLKKLGMTDDETTEDTDNAPVNPF